MSLEISEELDGVSNYLEKRIKKLRVLRSKQETLSEKVSIEKRVRAAEKTLHAFRKFRFELEDEAGK